MLVGSNVRLVSIDSGLEKLGTVESFIGDRMTVRGVTPEGPLEPEAVWVEAYGEETACRGTAHVVSASGDSVAVALSRAAMPRHTALRLAVAPNCLTGQFDNRLFFISGLGPNALGYASGGSLAETQVAPVLVRSQTGSLCVQVSVEREETVCNVFRGFAALKGLSDADREVWRLMCLETGRADRALFGWDEGETARAA